MNSKELIVKGIGNVSAAPDLIVLELELEVIEPEYEKTMQRAAELLDALRAAIISAGHAGKSLKTTSFNIDTEYKNYRDNNNNLQKEFIGYSCKHELRLEFGLDMNKLGATLGAIADCEANPDIDIKFSVKDTSAVSEQLLNNAISNAKWKAAILAKSAGIYLGDIKCIDYNWSELHMYSDTNMVLAEGKAFCSFTGTSPVDITPKDIDVSDSVTVIWSIE